MITVNIKLYGPFKDMAPTEFISVKLPKGSDIQQLKNSLIETLTPYANDRNLFSLVEASAFAIDNQIIHNTVCIEQDTELSILPPVSGG